MKYLYAFIGAGPATLAAVSSLPGWARLQSVILDQGQHHRRRVCPELKSKSCSSCFGANCHVTSGLGGASAMFGNKFCDFPASDGIRQLMAQPLAKAREVSSQPSQLIEYPNSPNRKVYGVEISSMDAYRRHSEVLISDVTTTTDIREGFDVETISEARGDFTITSAAGEDIVAKNVVVASGRSGHRPLRKWLKALGVGYSENSPDIGVRVEVETATINKRFFYQDDPKFKFDYPGLGHGRTFCTCRGGMIVPVKFGNGYFADGAFARKDTGRTNVALMGRTLELHEAQVLEDWCADVVSGQTNSLVRGEFDLDSISSSEIVSSILDLVPEGPTPRYKKVLAALTESVVGDPAVAMFGSGERHGYVKVYGPAIDRYWPRVALSKGFSTTKHGLYVIGDAAGISRGIVQAAAAGRSWAASQAEQMRDVAFA